MTREERRGGGEEKMRRRGEMYVNSIAQHGLFLSLHFSPCYFCAREFQCQMSCALTYPDEPSRKIARVLLLLLFSFSFRRDGFVYYFRVKISVFWIIRRGREGDWTKEKNVGKDWWRRYNRISIQWYLLIFIENFILFLILS